MNGRVKALSENASVWKWISGTLGTLLLALLIGWFSFANDVVRKKDILEFTQPIVEAVKKNTETLEKLNDNLDEIKLNAETAKGDYRVLEQRVGAIEKKLRIDE